MLQQRGYQLRSLNIFFLLFLVAACTGLSHGLPSLKNTHEPRGSGVWYQIHSWNDANQWESAFAKGITYWKLDFYWMPQSFCKTQQRVNQDERGCFVLTHDTPLPTQLYNTSADVLSFIADDKNSKYFKTPTKIFTALCFKAPPKNLCNSTEGAGWISLIDDFFNYANDIINSKQLNVEFILDGASTPDGRDCLKDKWRPWVATWIAKPVLAFLSDDKSKGYDRFQVYDLFANSLVVKTHAVFNFGKFSNGTYPLLIWEPNNEEDFCLFISIYQEWLQNTPNQVVPPLVFAINMDAIQFQVFVSSCTPNIATHKLLYDRNDVTPFVISFSLDDSDVAVILFQERFNSTLLVSPVSELQQAQNIHAQPINGPSFVVSALSSIANGQNHRLVLATSNDGHYVLYLVDSMLTPKLLSQGQLHQDGNATSVIYQFVDSRTTNVYPIIVSAEVYTDYIQLRLWKFSMVSNGSLTLFPMIVPPVKIPFFRASSINKLSISLMQDALSTKCSIEGLLSVSTVDAQVYVGYVCGKIDTGELAVDFGLVDIGKHSTVSVAYIGNTLYGLEVHGEGYCWNTEERNKRPTPLLCESTPVSTPNILNYNIGTLESWKAVLRSQKQVSACNTDILHGTYDLGKLPSASLLSSASNQPQVIALHQGLLPSDKDVSDCGRPRTFSNQGGIVIDSWKFNPRF